MDLTISVIVPVFNRENLIIRTLDSILNQTKLPYELIIVDNNSTDSTVEKVEHWIEKNSGKGIRIRLLSEPKRGAYAARQKGLIEAKGNYVIFFDSDDTMRPDLIKKAEEVVSQFPTADIVCWKCKLNKLDGKTRVPPFYVGNALESHLIHSLLCTIGYMSRKDFLVKAGGWSKSLPVWDDLELGLRLLLKNPELRPINEVLCDIYSQEESITGTDFSSRQGEWENTLREMERENELSNHSQKKRVKKIIDYRRAILAANYYREGNKKGARTLMQATLENKNFRVRSLLKFSYHYTKAGLRGVWRLVRLAY